MIVKARNKVDDRYCLGKTLERQERADVKDPNGDYCKAKKPAVTRLESCIDKILTKELKDHDEEPGIAGPGNTRKKVSDISEAIFRSTSDGF